MGASRIADVMRRMFAPGILAAGAASGTSFEQAVSAQSPESWWSFNELSGASTATDRQGNDNGTYQDSPTLEATANEGTALEIPSFTGAGRRMEVSNKNDTAFTLIVFFSVADVTTRQVQFVFSAATNEFNNGWQMMLDNQSTTDSNQVRGYCASGNTWAPGTIPVDTWVMGALRWDNVSGDRIVNLNLGKSTTNTASNLAAAGSKAQFCSQIKDEGTRGSRWFEGKIDEAIYFTSSISDANLESIYNAYFGL